MGLTDLLSQYGDDGDSHPSAEQTNPSLSLHSGSGAAPKAMARSPRPDEELIEASFPIVDAAPNVDLLGKDVVLNFAHNPSHKKILTNPSVGALFKPLVGPVEVGKTTIEQKFVNHQIGHVERANMSQFAFDQQYLTFHNFGYAQNPCRDIPVGQETLVSTEAEPQYGRTIYDKAVKRRRLEEAPAQDAVKEEE